MRKKITSRLVLFAIAIAGFTSPALAQTSKGVSGGMLYLLYAAAGFIIVAGSIAVLLVIKLKKYKKEVSLKTGRQIETTGLGKWWSNLDKKLFTRAVPVEKEADVLLDHDYDGVRELDNALPPWWKWGFYITLIIGVFYMFRFHVWHTGPTPEEEYNKEMQVAAAEIELNRSTDKNAVNENTVTLADANGIAAGKKVFTGTCFPCHGANGEGNAVGPNLTDKYWLHGGSLSNVFKTITNGVPDKGMQAWGKTFSSAEIKNIASYVLSLQGSNPANAKASQGDLFSPTAKADSSSVKKDSVLKK